MLGERNGTIRAKIETVIHTTTRRGEGIAENPYRDVEQYWTADGFLLAEYDPSSDDIIDALRAGCESHTEP